MKFEKWVLPPSPEAEMRTLMEAGYPYLISAVLAPRGICTPEAAAHLLQQTEKLTLDPMEMRDMDLAVGRIRKALEHGEKIAVFGDYDVDGITSTCLVTDALRRSGADCVYYIPHRLNEGYGLNCGALQKLQDEGVKLVITVDCGITGVEEADFAREIGLDLIITDHHECKERLPDAIAVVDPHRPDCPYPFKNLAGVGVALKLVMAVFGPEQHEALFARYCTLAAMGTIADVMSMTGENRTIVHCGLDALPEADCIGLHALLAEAGLAGKNITSTNVGFVLAPRINAAGRVGEAMMAAELFLTKDPARAEELARDLCGLNKMRQQLEHEIFDEAVERIEAMDESERNALVLESDSWHQGVVGIVASRLSEKYSCPSFMIHLNGDVGKGSCRSWGGFNLFAALEECQDLLLGFGGHELAAGFTIEREKIPAFRKKMNACARAAFGAECPVSSVEIDAVLTHPNLLNLREAESLDLLEPYGADNPRPVFCIQGLTVDSLQNVGQNKHLKLRLKKGAVQLDGIFFSANTETCGVGFGDRVDAAFYLNINEFRSNRTLQLQLVDIRLSLEPSVREREDLQKAGRFFGGGEITHQEALHLLPERSQFAGCWRCLNRLLPEEGEWRGPYLPMLRKLERHLGGSDPFLRTMMCLRVFDERGLLQLSQEGDDCVLCRVPITGKADLQASVYVQTLQSLVQNKR